MTFAVAGNRSTGVSWSRCKDRQAGDAPSARTVALSGFAMVAFAGVAAASFAAAMAGLVVDRVLPRRFRADRGEDAEPGF